MQLDNVTFKIVDNELVNLVIEENGKKSTKVVQLKDFIAAFTDSTNVEETPLMPASVIKYWKNGPNTVIFLNKPGRNVDMISSYSKDPIPIRIPNTVYALKFKNNRLIKTIIGSYDDKRLTKNTKIFKFPMHNYSSTFSPGICWGSNFDMVESVCAGMDLFNIETIPDLYWASKFNTDLGGDCNVKAPFEELKTSALGNGMPERLIGEASRFNRFVKLCALMRFNPTLKFDVSNYLEGVSADSLEAFVSLNCRV